MKSLDNLRIVLSVPTLVLKLYQQKANVGLMSSTALAQHQPNIGPMPHVCWEVRDEIGLDRGDP